MPIPDSDRIIYGSNPLSEVVCQLKFPIILRIESEAPASFQEAIRHDYPIYKEPQAPGIPQGLPPDLARLVGSVVSLPLPKVHEFSTEDGVWRLTLSRDFLALTCSRYERWEQFVHRFKGPFSALLQVYKPAFFSRVGLRYQNVIRRSVLGLVGVPWSELLQPHVSGPLSSEIAGEIDELSQALDFTLPDQHGKVTMRHGLIQEQPGGEIFYLIDNDFYIEGRTVTEDATARLEYFNKYSGRVFRWCVRPRLDKAMHPQVIQRSENRG